MIYQDAMFSAMQPARSEDSWDTLSDSLNGSLDRLEEIVNDIDELSAVCRDEWCDAANCMLDEATVAVFAISEPHWMSEEYSKKLKSIKKRIHDLHKSRSSSTSSRSDASSVH